MDQKEEVKELFFRKFRMPIKTKPGATKKVYVKFYDSKKEALADKNTRLELEVYKSEEIKK